MTSWIYINHSNKMKTAQTTVEENEIDSDIKMNIIVYEYVRLETSLGMLSIECYNQSITILRT